MQQMTLRLSGISRQPDQARDLPEIIEDRHPRPGGTIIDILNASLLTLARGSCAGFEALLASQRSLVFEQQGEPLGGARVRALRG